MPDGAFRPSWAEVDVGALRHNAAVLGQAIAPASLCAVVKADGYGHGAVTAARAALAGGASMLAVALVEEGVALRDAGIADRVLLLCEPPFLDAAAEIARRGIEATVCTLQGVERALVGARRTGKRVGVHVKVDTGMHRLGATPEEVGGVIDAVLAGRPSLELVGLWTHMAVADGPSPEDRSFTQEQLRRFRGVLDILHGNGLRLPILHCANSAAALAYPASRYDLARCGIALYGEWPSPAVQDACRQSMPDLVLQPALSIKSRVTEIRELEAGARPSYGRHRPLPARSFVATVPLGYADGVPRRLFGADFEVLVGGRRRPLAGMVTMDQIVVDCGSTPDVAVGDEAVLLGRQGDEVVTASEWADKLGTINYEVLTGIGTRVPRVPVDHELELADRLQQAEGPDEAR
jgi:alanine racemase